MSTSTIVALAFAGVLGYRSFTHVRTALDGRARRLRSLGATPVTVTEVVAMADAARAELGDGAFAQHVVVSGAAEPAGDTRIEGATQTTDELVERPDDEGVDLGIVRILSSPDRTIRREWVLRPGTRLTVVADVREADGTLTAQERPDAPIRISAGTSSEAVEADERAERTGWRSGALFAAGAAVALLVALLGGF